MELSIIIPAYNESGSIKTVLEEIPCIPQSEVIVVDGGSVDGTMEIARGHGAKVLTYHNFSNRLALVWPIWF